MVYTLGAGGGLFSPGCVCMGLENRQRELIIKSVTVLRGFAFQDIDIIIMPLLMAIDAH